MVMYASVREKHGQRDCDHMTKLTPPSLRTLLKKPGRHSDGQGLFFRVLGQNKAYFVYRFRLNGREREMSLGPWPELGLGEARRKHAEMRAQVLNRIDPLAHKHDANPAFSGVATFGEIADDYVETHEGAWRSSKHRRQWRMTLTEYCKPIWSKPVDEITTADVLACLKPVWARTPETASRLRGRIETVIDAARVLGHVPEDKANPARWKGHLDHLLPRRNKLDQDNHHRALPHADVAELVKRLRASSRMTALALEFLILTATRTSETLNARWSEFDLEADTWLIPKERMKMGKPHDVPLSDRAIEILVEARRRARKEPTPDSFVFFGSRPKMPLSPMSMSEFLRCKKINTTVHGFRSAARSWMADNAVPFELAEACLAHQVGNAVVQAYQRSSMLERRRPIMSAWASFMSGESDANVVPLRKAGA
jgi:integrase